MPPHRALVTASAACWAERSMVGSSAQCCRGMPLLGRRLHVGVPASSSSSAHGAGGKTMAQCNTIEGPSDIDAGPFLPFRTNAGLARRADSKALCSAALLWQRQRTVAL